ncbi:MAG: LacI family DNA-binding transcriptional regulator [bacterium]
MRSSIEDVARLARVSIATVSRVVNNTVPVRPETRERVIRAIEALDYRPNAIARSLVTKRTHIIGLVIPDIANPVFAEAARGVEEVTSKGGYNVILCNTGYSYEREIAYIDVLREKRMDGLIIATAQRRDDYILGLKRRGFPCVLILSKVEGEEVDYVVVDNVRGAFIATEHLIRLGHVRIAHIGGPRNISSGLDRWKGYSKALREHGIAPEDDLYVEGAFDEESGHEAMERLLDLPRPPSAVFCANDLMAIGAMFAIKEGGLRIPRDVAVVGYDDTRLAKCVSPALTAVRQPSYRIGVMASDLLIRTIEGKKPQCGKIVLEPELIVRESCGANEVGGNLW